MTDDPIAAQGIDLAPLFTPLAIGDCLIPNRIVMAPMTRNFARDGVLPEAAAEYYARRARGGTGLIITEGIATSDIGAHSAGVPHLFGEAALRPWRAVTEAVHAAGGKIMAQLWHTGLGRMRERAARPDILSIGPMRDYLDAGSSLVAAGGSHELGRAMDERDIAGVIEEFAAAAANAERVGFDGVEIHAAHGYLLDQFFWGESNRRADAYNGDIAARTRLACEIVLAMRSRIRAGFPIGLRFSQWKLPAHYEIRALADSAALAAFLAPLAAAGVDFFDASTRRYWDPAFPEENDLTLSGWTRRITGKPTMTVGSVGLEGPLNLSPADWGAEVRPQANLAPLVGMIERGECDLIGVGRALIANPDWAARVRAGDTAGLAAYSASALAMLV